MTPVWLFYEPSPFGQLVRAYSLDEMLADRYAYRHPEYVMDLKYFSDERLGPFMYLHVGLQINMDYITDDAGHSYTIAMDGKESDELSHYCEVITDSIQTYGDKFEKLPFKGAYKKAIELLANEMDITFDTVKLERDIRYQSTSLTKLQGG